MRTEKTPTRVITTPLGTGKTTTVCQMIEEKNLRAIILSPTHDLATEIQAKFDGDTIHIQGKDRLVEGGFECPFHSEISRRQSKGLGSYSKFCSQTTGCCHIRRDCEYHNQFELAQSHQIIILTHDHLSLSETIWEKLCEDRDLIVLDENFLPKLRKEEIITRKDLTLLRKALVTASCRSLEWSWVKPLQTALKAGSSVCLEVKHSPSGRELAKIDKAFEALKGRNVIRVLTRAAQQGSVFRYRASTVDVHGRAWNRILTTNIRANLPRGLPLYVLDSTCKPEYYQWALGEDYDVRGIDPSEGHALPRNAHIIQCLSGGYSNSTLFDASGEPTRTAIRIREFLQDKTDGEDSYGIISTKKFEDYISDYFPRDKLLHFNKLRGLNTFNTVKRLFIIGFQGISYADLARQARIVFDQDWDDEVEASKLEEQQDYVSVRHYRNGQQTQIQTLVPQNPHIRALYDMQVRGEIEQALGRARIHLDKAIDDREIYIITSIPLECPVDVIISIWDEEKSEALIRLIDAARKLLNAKSEFSRSDLRSKTGISMPTIIKHVGYLRAELDLMEISTGHNKFKYVPRVKRETQMSTTETTDNISEKGINKKISLNRIILKNMLEINKIRKSNYKQENDEKRETQSYGY